MATAVRHPRLGIKKIPSPMTLPATSDTVSQTVNVGLRSSRTPPREVPKLTTPLPAESRQLPFQETFRIAGQDALLFFCQIDHQRFSRIPKPEQVVLGIVKPAGFFLA